MFSFTPHVEAKIKIINKETKEIIELSENEEDEE